MRQRGKKQSELNIMIIGFERHKFVFRKKGKKRELEVGAGDSVNTKGDTKANEQATGPRKKQKVMEPPVKGLTTRAQAKACQNRTSNRKK